MKPLTTITGALLLFGAGYLAGHYDAVSPESNVASTKIEIRNAPTQIATAEPMGNSLTKASQATKSIVPPPHAKSETEDSLSTQQPTAEALPPPHEMILSEETKAQLIAQQVEARASNIRQMGEMIQSMEEGGAPAEDIKNFRELKASMEEQPIEESLASEATIPERTDDELAGSLEESLVQANVPIQEREKMLEAFTPPTDTTSDSIDADPPHQEHQ